MLRHWWRMLQRRPQALKTLRLPPVIERVSGQNVFKGVLDIERAFFMVFIIDPIEPLIS